MGIVLDTTMFVSAERRRLTVSELILEARSLWGNAEIALSAMTASELIHGVWRARDEGARARRQEFVEEVFARIEVRPFSLRTARIAGRIEATLRANGVRLSTADIVIGATALELGFAVATHNVRHFGRIPQLRIIQLK